MTTSLITAVITCLTWILAALVSRSLTDVATHGTAVWLAPGVTFGLLLAVQSGSRLAVLVGTGAAALILAISSGLPVLQTLLLSANELVSPAAGVWLALQFRAAPDSKPQPGRAYAGLVLGAALTAVLGASLAVMTWAWLLPQQIALATEWRVWVISAFVGTLLVAPVASALTSLRIKRSGGMTGTQFWAGGFVLLLFFGVSTLIFSSDVSDRFGTSLGPTLTYLPLPFMVLNAVIWKERGSALATLAGALALIAWTNAGGGPFTEIEAFPGEAVIEVQGYVAVMALLVGVVNSLGAMNKLALQEAHDWRTQYTQVLASNRTFVVNFDAATGRAQWGEEASAFLRINTSALLTINDVIAKADPEVQSALQADWQGLLSGQQEHVQWDTTLHWAGNGTASISARLSSVRGADGQVEQVAGLVEVHSTAG
jgi:integral membrane sensor domain MASE1